MIYVIGIVGFISGFALGQFILLGLLKDKSNEELLENKKLKWTYGLLNWIVAIVVCITSMRLYRIYF